ncbi:MAG TPA: hypothetical protein PKA63_10645 [Oligoflexia bacterium]|nr:hypothetical protein [Oligoflexia bacterium]HMP49116.1 hypothetical protein [Oligoflexia bacterium]
MKKTIIIHILIISLLFSCSPNRINLEATNKIKIEKLIPNYLKLETWVFQEGKNLLILGELTSESRLSQSIYGHVHVTIETPKGEDFASEVLYLRLIPTFRMRIPHHGTFQFVLPKIPPEGSLLTVKYDVARH